MSVEGRRPRHKPDGDSHNGSAADSDSARGSSILSSPTTPQQRSCCGFFFPGCSAVGSALGSGPRGRGFESRHSDHKKLFHRLVKELFVFHGVTGFKPTASPQRDTNSPVDCLRGCGRIRARLPHRALWTVPRQNSPRKTLSAPTSKATHASF